MLSELEETYATIFHIFGHTSISPVCDQKYEKLCNTSLVEQRKSGIRTRTEEMQRIERAARG